MRQRDDQSDARPIRDGSGPRPAPVLVAVAVAGALALVLLAGSWACSPGGAGSGEPERLTLEQLVFGQEDYDGRRVRTSGVVRRFGAEDGAIRLHYVVEDEHANRVELVGADVSGYEGRAVEVTGRFRFVEEEGRTLEVERIEPR